MKPAHENFPEVEAYSQQLSLEGAVSEIESSVRHDRSYDILWLMMGLYARRPTANYIVHDYRSLSVGRASRMKDMIKRRVNHRPDLRVFQNEEIRTALGFDDLVPFHLLPMGVPEWLADIRPAGPGEGAMFCYLGAMSRERRFDLLLESFLRNRERLGGELLLIGEPEDQIRNRFGNSEGLRFVGRLKQVEALSLVAASNFAVCYFPTHRPHTLQVPTKLLEYAALGLKILCNEHPRSREVAQIHELPCHFSPDFIFDALTMEDLDGMEPVRATGLMELSWPAVIRRSGVLEAVGAG